MKGRVASIPNLVKVAEEVLQEEIKRENWIYKILVLTPKYGFDWPSFFHIQLALLVMCLGFLYFLQRN
jgi:hypothetical protein